MAEYSDSTPNGFSVMTVNLRFGLADDGPNNWIFRQKSFPALFEAFRPDFIGMQEANGFQVDYFKELLDDYHCIGQRLPPPATWQDTLIFYKKTWRCRRHERFFLSHTPTVPSKLPGSIWPRQCTFGLFEKDHRKLVCASTHLDFETPVQVESARIITGRLKQKGLDAPTILMGDFNTEPHTPPYDFLTRKETCRPPFREIHEGAYASTFHGFTGIGTGAHIDWMMYRGSIELLEKKIIEESFRGYFPSDHFPVIARFGWREAGDSGLEKASDAPLRREGKREPGNCACRHYRSANDKSENAHRPETDSNVGSGML